MSRSTIRVLATAAIIITVVVFTSLWVIRHYYLTDKPPVVQAVVIGPKSKHPPGWQKINVDGKLSFYIPSEMNQFEPIGNIEYFGPTKFFNSQTLELNYCYIRRRLNEETWAGRVSCDLLTNSHHPAEQGSEIEIGGRRARQVVWQSDAPKHLFARICFPDVGDGTIVTLGAAAEDERSLDIAKEIFGSIEFP
jgi:hypothetical protein